MKNFRIIIILFGGMLTARADSTTNDVVISSELIRQLLDEARTNSPMLRAAGSRAKAAVLNAGSVRAWEDPTATLGGTTYGERGFAASEEGDLSYGVEQKLPLWGRPKLNRAVAGAETATRQAEADLREQELRRDLTKGLLAAALAARVVEIDEQDLAWLDITVKTVESRYGAGSAVLADTLQIQNERAKRNNEQRTDRDRLAHAQFTLNRILNRKPDSSWPLLRLPEVGPAIPLSGKMLDLALQNEPKLKVMEQEIKRARATAELTRKSRLPDVSVGVDGRQYSGDGGFRSGMFSVKVSLPWFNGGKYRRDYEREREKWKSAEEDREDELLTVREELHHLSVDIDAARREALLYDGEITSRASQALSSRLADWETGRGMFRDVLDARRTLLDSELTSARAVAEQNEMFADLLLWTGLENLEQLAPLANEPSLLPEHDHLNHDHE